MFVKKKLLLIGSGSHSRSVIDIGISVGYKSIELFDLNFSKLGNNSILNFKVINSYNYLKKNLDKYKKNNFFISVGSSTKRKEIFNSLKKNKNIKMINLVSKKSYISKYVKMGVNNLIAHGAYIGPNTILGDNNIINTKVIVEHDVRIGNHCHLCPGTIIAGNVKIGDNVFIGMGSIIKNGINIPSNSVLDAGSVIINKIDEKRIKKKK